MAMATGFQVFNTTVPSQFITVNPIAQGQVLPWWTELPSTLLDFLLALYEITLGWESGQQVMKFPCMRRRRQRDASRNGDFEMPAMDDARALVHQQYRSPGLLKQFGQWHYRVWGRENRWHFSCPRGTRCCSEPFWEVCGSYWDALGLVSTFCQVVSGMAYLYHNRNTLELIQPPTGNTYLEAFAVVTFIFSPRMKSNMFTFIWMWLIVLLTFAFQILLNVLPNHNVIQAPLYELQSDYCVNYLGYSSTLDGTCSAATGGYLQLPCNDITSNPAVNDYLTVSAVPWQYNCAYLVILVIGMLIGLCTYWWPEKSKTPGDVFRLLILLTLAISAGGFYLQASQQRDGIHLDFLVCPNVSNSTTGSVPINSSCVCQTFQENFVPTWWRYTLEDAVLSRFIYNIV